MTYNVFGGTLNPAQSNLSCGHFQRSTSLLKFGEALVCRTVVLTTVSTLELVLVYCIYVTEHIVDSEVGLLYIQLPCVHTVDTCCSGLVMEYMLTPCVASIRC